MNVGTFVEYTNRTSDSSGQTKSHDRKEGGEFVMCPLDGCAFSSGALRGVAYKMLQNGLAARNESLVTLHANFLKGSNLKLSVQKQYGLWLTKSTDALGADGDGAHCDAYEPKDCLHHPHLCVSK
jgi:hypothetical protein